MYKLKLYVTGQTPRSKQLIQNLEDMFKRNCGGKYCLEVFNIFEHLEAAQKDGVFVTPTLIKTLPEPVRRIIGDLLDKERVLAGLDVEGL